jgi:hypothetical protein
VAPAGEAAALLRTAAGADVAVVDGRLVVPIPDLAPRALGAWEARVTVAAFALGWVAADNDPATLLSFAPATP